MNEQLYEEIKRRILHLEYQPGEPLPMRKLAKSLGVSTTPVRETLVRLTNEKLVEWTPHSTARVAQVSYKELRDVIELRLLLEEHCGMLAARRIPLDTLGRSEELLRQLDGEADLHRVMQIDAELHDIVYEGTQNAMLARFLRLLRHKVATLWFLIEPGDKWARIIASDWPAMLTALSQRDEERSARLHRSHVEKFVAELERPLGAVRDPRHPLTDSV
jgi:DNA-binding GntR family transcriptional regulator